MAASSHPTRKRPTSRQMSFQPALASSGNSPRSCWAASAKWTPAQASLLKRRCLGVLVRRVQHSLVISAPRPHD
eukprot:15408254-Alexandrium_andersonii.AAC.1